MFPVPPCVVYNPGAGRGRAREQLARLKQILPSDAIFRPSQGPGDAETQAYRAVLEGCRLVAAAGGDGTVHEVANGILRAGQPEAMLAVLPIGSANDYAYSLGIQPVQPDRMRLSGWKPRPVDVGQVRSPGRPKRYFVNGLGLGINGAVTYESRCIRHLRGVPLYTAALFRALRYHYRFPAMRVEIDGKERETPTLAFSAAIGQREGNFVLAPRAQVDDGWFDYFHAGPIRWWEILRYVPGMITGSLPTHPSLWMGRCRRVSIHSDEPVPVHLDGELYGDPGRGVSEVEIELLPHHLLVYGPGKE